MNKTDLRIMAKEFIRSATPDDGQSLESVFHGLLQLLSQITKKGRHDVSPSQEEKIVYTL